jgi:Acetyl/propionyl-CoA carboxylase, alpha subunit
VTEEVTGLDIVELMLRIAAGEGLPVRQQDLQVQGHAVEARVCAEDAAQNFMPSTGELVEVRFAASGVRVESGVRAGMVVTPFYDPMLAKLIVHAPTRNARSTSSTGPWAKRRCSGWRPTSPFCGAS